MPTHNFTSSTPTEGAKPDTYAIYEASSLCSSDPNDLTTLRIDKVRLTEELETIQIKLLKERDERQRLYAEHTKTQRRVQELETLLLSRESQVASLETDLKVLNGKYIDEIEKVSELSLAKQLVEGEYVELSSSLFEQANGMVASEAKQRFELELANKALERQLAETRERLVNEVSQLQELKEKLQISTNTQPNSKVVVCAKCGSEQTGPDLDADKKTSPVGDDVDEISIYSKLLNEFEAFLARSSDCSMSRINGIPYMKRCLEEDIEPCLKLGDYASYTPRKLADAILMNTLTVEEIHPIAAPANGCHTCGRETECKYRFRIDNQAEWIPIEKHCRDRLYAVGEFYTYLRNIHMGHFAEHKINELWNDSINLRLQMVHARLGILSCFDTLPAVMIEHNTLQNYARRLSTAIDRVNPDPAPEFPNNPAKSSFSLSTKIDKLKPLFKRFSAGYEEQPRVAKPIQEQQASKSMEDLNIHQSHTSVDTSDTIALETGAE
ncbi:hypothetical protein K493DRAFT_285989 [Basidiobolus meristosporus CBS 931.73]|uniref:GDP/GTP exchange factor Sec2 N-terminal domain-containing protein n=1 Tax=Basidiobolus meristosporus CBS 931.73 TaxID=1314790 RepID=A0A1Y1Y3P2_9FUNG|nr:hypothetical protein K493DRAFT_285989 [Basidiobolus meristosporus CBS 931.73]|eukprot:ORX92214.1 hypothetical protein K493DRAFT_285989 [Basidiobolus meristosporus CBS 931.73]